jgi:Dual specificity phosphatase, catalytic domain
VRYSLTFLVLAAALVAVALEAWKYAAWTAIMLFYAALSFGLLAAAYAGVGPGLLLKRATGYRSLLSWLLFAPYFLLSAVTFGLYRLLSREPAYVQVAPNLFFGRWLSASEAEAVGWVSILDLAAEFPAGQWERTRPAYRSLPVLDSAVPSEEELRSAAAWIGESISAGPLYVHCALGHGRSACVIIAYLLSVGAVGTVAEGVRRLQSLRSGVRLHTSQLRLLHRFESQAVGQGAEPGTVRSSG